MKEKVFLLAVAVFLLFGLAVSGMGLANAAPPTYVTQVVSYTPGPGAGLPYTDTNRCLGAPDNKAVSLGNGGSIVLGFNNPMVGTTTLQIIEASGIDEQYSVEIAGDLTASQPWTLLGIKTGTAYLDLSTYGLTGSNYRYMRITDQNKKASDTPNAGFDLDAVVVSDAEGWAYANEVFNFFKGPGSGAATYDTSEPSAKYGIPWRALGPPADACFSMGVGGWAVFGFDVLLMNGDGADLKIIEGTGTPEGASFQLWDEVNVKWVPDTPIPVWGTTELDLAAYGLTDEYRYARIIDDGTNEVSSGTRGYDLDAIVLNNWVTLEPKGYATQVIQFSPGSGIDPLTDNPNNALYLPDTPPMEGAAPPDRTVHLGQYGSIVLEVGPYPLTDGEGPDFKVFEPASGSQTAETFSVEVWDGAQWHTLNPSVTERNYYGIDPATGAPVPTGPTSFDLSQLGANAGGPFYRIRITDTGIYSSAYPNTGYDLDAVVLYNTAEPKPTKITYNGPWEAVVDDLNRMVRTSLTVSATLAEEAGTPLVGKTLTFELSSPLYGAHTVSATTGAGGLASATFNDLPVDPVSLSETYTLRISFAGDDEYKPSEETARIEVYALATGFTTGGGWYQSASDGRCNFGFTAKSGKRGSGQGELEFQNQEAEINLHSTTIAAPKFPTAKSAWFTGTARVNGTEGYTFRVDVVDNGTTGASDSFAISIRRPDGTLLHNSSGTLSGGNILVKTKTTPGGKPK